MAKWLYKSVLLPSTYYVYAKTPSLHATRAYVIRKFKRRNHARKFAKR